jgi:protein-disulfide isomerase
LIENPEAVNYNGAVVIARSSLIIACVAALTATACEKKKPVTDTAPVNALDRANEDKGPVDKTPLPGIDAGKLSGERQELFYKLVGSLKSPCGKSHSLRTSFTQDTSCKRAPYAVKYVLQLLVDEVPDAKVREYYTQKYESTAKAAELDLSKAPYIGKSDAPVRLVEFYDYACPACVGFAPILKKVAADNEGKVVEYFMMFPLEASHPDSRSAAQASLAVWQLDRAKWADFHHMLFDRMPQHNKDFVTKYAAQAGFDTSKFLEAYQAANSHVTADQAQGDKNGVKSTPTLFFNDRKYEGPMSPEYIGMWIEEELAVNR